MSKSQPAPGLVERDFSADDPRADTTSRKRWIGLDVSRGGRAAQPSQTGGFSYKGSTGFSLQGLRGFPLQKVRVFPLTSVFAGCDTGVVPQITDSEVPVREVGGWRG